MELDIRIGEKTKASPDVVFSPVISKEPGASAYEIAKRHGYEGTEEEWLRMITGGDKFSLGYTIGDNTIDLLYLGEKVSSLPVSDILVSGMVTEVELSDHDAHGDEGLFLKMTFVTGDVVYIDLEEVIGIAFRHLQDDVNFLKDRDIVGTEEEIEAMEKEEGKFYYAYED